METVGSAVDIGTIAAWALIALRALMRIIWQKKEEVDSNAASKEFSRPRSQLDDGISLEKDCGSRWVSLFCAEMDKMDGLDRVGIRIIKFEDLVIARRNGEISHREFVYEIDGLTARSKTEQPENPTGGQPRQRLSALDSHARQRRNDAIIMESLFVANRVAPADGCAGAAEIGFGALSDAIDGALAALGDRRDIRIVRLRLGLENGQAHTLEAVGREFGITRERVRQLQSGAMAKLRRNVRAYPFGVSDSANALKNWGEIVGERLGDDGFARAFSKMTGADEALTAAHIRFLLALSGTPDDERTPPKAADSRVIQILAQSRDPVSLDALKAVVMSDSEAMRALRDWPKLDLSMRMKLVLDVKIDADGMCTVAEKTLSGVDRRDRRLFAMDAALREAGKPLHFTEIAERAKPLMPGHFAMSERNVHAWLSRYEDRFKWAGAGTFGLAEWDIGVRESELDDSLKSLRRTGVGDEIALLLSERGEPLAMDEIERHVLDERGFAVNRGSVAASVAQDAAGRFATLSDGRVALSQWRNGGTRPARRQKSAATSSGTTRRVRLSRELRDAARESAYRRAEEIKALVARGVSRVPPAKAAGYAIIARELGLADEFAALMTVAERNETPPGMADELRNGIR